MYFFIIPNESFAILNFVAALKKTIGTAFALFSAKFSHGLKQI